MNGAFDEETLSKLAALGRSLTADDGKTLDDVIAERKAAEAAAVLAAAEAEKARVQKFWADCAADMQAARDEIRRWAAQMEAYGHPLPEREIARAFRDAERGVNFRFGLGCD